MQMCRCTDCRVAEKKRCRGAKVLRGCASAGVGAGLGEEGQRERGAADEVQRCRGAEVKR